MLDAVTRWREGLEGNSMLQRLADVVVYQTPEVNIQLQLNCCDP